MATREPQQPTSPVEDRRQAPRLEIAGRMTALGVSISTLLLLTVLPDGPVPLAVATLAVAVALAWWLTSGFWRTVALGSAGGIVAGLVILGPGWRVAMRVVAIMDTSTTPEFTFDGATFILIVVGAVLGGAMGIVGNLVTTATRIQTASVSGIVLGLVLTVSLPVHFAEELTNLGGGLLVNLTLFGAVAIVYGIAAMHIADRLEARFTRGPGVRSPVASGFAMILLALAALVGQIPAERTIS